MNLINSLQAGASALLLAALPGCQAAPGAPAGTEVERRLSLMGTWLELRVEAEDRGAALAASEAAVRVLEATEARLSTWRPDAELSQFHAGPAGRVHPVSPALRQDLEAALRWRDATGGAFQPAVGALVQAWGLRDGGRRPGAAQLAAARRSYQSGQLRLEPGGLLRTDPALLIEEGGFGKGRGLDLALAALRDAGANRATVNLGGQLAWLNHQVVEVPVAHPLRRDEVAMWLRLDGGSLAASGNSERGIVVDGQRLGHLLDPRTGAPAPDFGSLHVWAPDATAADCLSTGLSALGPDAALAWAEGHPGIEVLILEPGDAQSLRVRASSGLADRITYPDPRP